MITRREFVGPARRSPADTIVVHESVTYSLDSTIAVLKKRGGLGVHYGLPPEGGVVELCSPGQIVSHARGLNARSIGIEIVSPYYPEKDGRARAPWQRVIPARWAHRGAYVLPTEAQAVALYDLIVYLRRVVPSIPDRWVGVLNGGKFAMGRVTEADKMQGIQAHTYTHHADGGFPVLYCYLRDRFALDHTAAWTRASELAKSASATAVSL